MGHSAAQLGGWWNTYTIRKDVGRTHSPFGGLPLRTSLRGENAEAHVVPSVVDCLCHCQMI